MRIHSTLILLILVLHCTALPSSVLSNSIPNADSSQIPDYYSTNPGCQVLTPELTPTQKLPALEFVFGDTSQGILPHSLSYHLNNISNGFSQEAKSNSFVAFPIQDQLMRSQQQGSFYFSDAKDVYFCEGGILPVPYVQFPINQTCT